MELITLYGCQDGHLHSEEDVDYCDRGYVCPFNFEADAVSEQYVRLDRLVAWLHSEAGHDGAHGSIPALRAAADHIAASLATPSSGSAVEPCDHDDDPFFAKDHVEEKGRQANSPTDGSERP